MKHKAGFVNIIGRPNVGKSTLMNRLVGERLAIITSKAQTTRHRILGIVNEEDYQIVFSDTPGIIDPKYKMQESMMRFVRSSLQDADVLLVMVEPKHTEKDIELFKDKVKDHSAPLCLVLNKSEKLDQKTIDGKLNFWREYLKPDMAIAISALKGNHVDELFKWILEQLPESPPYYDKQALTDRPERFFVTEIIREKILLTYDEEIPYSVEVIIDAFKEEENITRISAIIVTNRKSQKPIIIGKGGSNLKKVGTLARKDMEVFLDKKVFLELFVKVKENWRQDNTFLKRRGYH